MTAKDRDKLREELRTERRKMQLQLLDIGHIEYLARLIENDDLRFAVGVRLNRAKTAIEAVAGQMEKILQMLEGGTTDAENQTADGGRQTDAEL